MQLALQEDFVARKDIEVQLAHCIHYHDSENKGETYAGVLWYWMSPNGAYLNQDVNHPPNCSVKTEPGPVSPGNYLHYKGNYYHVVDCLKLQGTDRYYVIYFPQKPGESIKWFYREANEFTELVKVGRAKKPRFRRI
jgi:hypothetical protein